ncbi:MAG: hypothetical protein U0587_04425 [Candidatus Binatia bacterium]
MRLIDLLLRAGPYGDGFDDDAEGLSLANIRGVPHAIDRGPLEPRLPDIHRTPGRRIPLANEPMVRDLGRLRRALRDRTWGGGFVFIGRRHLRDMTSWLHNSELLARGRHRCALLVNPRDAARLGLRAGSNAPPVCVRASARCTPKWRSRTR